MASTTARTPRPMPYRLTWPWTSQGVSDADEMIQILFDEIRNGAVSLTSLSGVLPVGNGGTGATSFSAGSVIFSNGTLLTQDADLTFSVDTLSATKVAMSSLTSGRVPFATTAGLLVDDADLTFSTDTLSATKLAASSLTSGRVPFATTAGLLIDDADLTFSVDTLTATKLVTTALTDSGLTSGRVPFASTGGLLTDDTDLTFSVDTLSATKVAMSSLTSGRVPFASTAGLLIDDSDMTFAVDTLTVTKLSAGNVAKSQFDHFADANNSGTAETDLYSDTLAAGRLATNGDKIISQYGGVFAGSATSTQQLRAYFGGTLIFDTGALAIGTATPHWELRITIVRESSSIVRCSAALTTSFASLSAYDVYTKVSGLTLANTQILKITGTAGGVGGGSNEITASEGYVAWLPAA